MKLIQQFLLNPKKLILLDGVGALFSAFILGFLFVRVQPVIGIPVATLYFLATLPVIFFICDVYIYFKKHHLQMHRYLNTIASLNLFYCICSLCLLLFHLDTITPLGCMYIVLEILIISLLAALEYKVAKQIATS